MILFYFAKTWAQDIIFNLHCIVITGAKQIEKYSVNQPAELKYLGVGHP